MIFYKIIDGERAGEIVGIPETYRIGDTIKLCKKIKSKTHYELYSDQKPTNSCCFFDYFYLHKIYSIRSSCFIDVLSMKSELHDEYIEYCMSVLK